MHKLSLRFRRCMALFCAVVTLLSSVGITSVSAQSDDINSAYIALEGKEVSAITLPQDGKLELQVQGIAGSFGYGWQIEDPEEKDRWVDIEGANSNALSVTYALVGSMLKQSGVAKLRCRLTKDNVVGYTDAVKVTVSFTPIQPTLQLVPQAGIVVNEAPPKRAANDEDYKTHSIVINYLFDNNALAFEPYGATVARGSNFQETITSPTVVGYKPVRRVGENYVDAETVVLDLTNIQEDVVINVVYEPTLVNFSVHHHLQNIYDDEYSLTYDYITTSQAVTGTKVGDGLAMTEEQLPGFRALAYEHLTVAADGSTIVEIRYDRNYYLIDFDMKGGYGTEPVYTRVGATVGANIPTRHGYVFDGWELVSYNGRTPTTEEAAKYNLSANSTIDVPAANLRYRARWITTETTYTLVFWKENAEDDGYSYWGYKDNMKAMSGSLVSAQDLISQVAGIDDEAYFKFNSERSDKDVLVEGDGSTVVNVYYTRNYYTITIKAKGQCTIPEKHSHGDACYDLVCAGYHVHSAECIRELVCTTEEHTEHTAACLKCSIPEHTHTLADCTCSLSEHTHTSVCSCKIEEHSHIKSCYANVGNQQNNTNGYPTGKENGYIYRKSNSYYIYIDGKWYRYNRSNVSSGTVVDAICNKEEHEHVAACSCPITEHTHNITDCQYECVAHTHGDACYRDTLHIHGDKCYKYNCGYAEHVHGDACKRLKCGIPTGHTHNNTCKSSTQTNTTKLITRKYQQSLADIWPIKDDHGKEYNSGQRWQPSESSEYSQVLVYIENMPADDFILTLNEASYDTFIMEYYLQTLPGGSGVSYNGKTYQLSHTVKANYNYLTKAEDFYDIKGFTQYQATPNGFGSNGQLDINGGGTVKMYYYRKNNNELTFNNRGDIVKTVTGIYYEEPLKQHNFDPAYPDNLEPGAYAFAGWYTSPGCFAGTEVDWDSIIMEDGGLQLYAKWAPITHKVRVFKDATLSEQIGEDQIVNHKAFAHAPDGNLTNGNYVFQGWFYKDKNGNEKAFVFTGIPVTQSMDIYAKWGSHIEVGYKIEYKLHLTGETVADPSEGVTIAGNNKTFTAKAGDELYSAYRTGYYPLVNSHTVTMSADGNHTFTFYYVYVPNMPYKVRYVDALTGQDLVAPKIVKDNTLSVVTETFLRMDEKMPDAYQKRLVLTANDEDKDGDGVWDDNVITFYYQSDMEHAYYRVVHYVQNMSGDDYREYRSQEAVGDIGSSYTFDALTLTGFVFDPSLTRINETVKPGTGNKVTATLTSGGLLVEMYYTRETVPYVVRYLNSTTREEIYPAKNGTGVFGELIAEYAWNLSSLGYELVGEQVKTLTLSANTNYNVMEFLYQERINSLKYQIIGPAEAGSLSRTSENVLAISGVTSGSMPMVNEGYAFKGWFLDEACTIPAPAEWVNPEDQKLTPVKTGDIWQDAIYYAKYIALETNLTVKVQGSDSRDDNQSYLFRIQGKPGTKTEGIDLTIAVVGNNSVTVTKVPIGEYTVTELTSWAWRYGCADELQSLTLEYSETGNTLIFNQSRENGYWLDGYTVRNNTFKEKE